MTTKITLKAKILALFLILISPVYPMNNFDKVDNLAKLISALSAIAVFLIYPGEYGIALAVMTAPIIWIFSYMAFVIIAKLYFKANKMASAFSSEFQEKSLAVQQNQDYKQMMAERRKAEGGALSIPEEDRAGELTITED